MKTYSRFKINFMKMKMLLSTLTTFTMFLVVLFAGCKKDDFVETIGVCPIVISTDPVNGAISVPYSKIITATFNEKMDPTSFNESSFTLQQGTTLIQGMVSYVDSTTSFKPNAPLLSFTSYQGTIKNTVKDKRGNVMQSDYKWSFVTMPEVILISSPILGGTTAGGGPFAVGATVTVTATPGIGYTFKNWTENGTVVSPIIRNADGASLMNNANNGTEVSTSSSYTFTMPAGNRTLTANFSMIVLGNFTINLSSNPLTGGTTSGGGTFIENSVQTVTAVPNTGYTFTNWTEGGIIVNMNANYQLAPLVANRTLVANFSPIPYTVAVSALPVSGGTTSGGGTYNYGSSVTVNAVSNAGYAFSNWTEGTTVVSTNANYQFTLTGNRTLVAHFITVPYTVVVSSLPILGGVTSGGGSFNYGTSVTVTAVPNTGFTFTNWTEGSTVVSTNANYQFNITSNRNLVANYAAIQYTVAVSSSPFLGGITSGGGTFNSGASVTVTAIANTGFTFTNWTEGTTVVSTNANYQFNITKNRVLVANYAENAGLIVTVLSNPLIGGITSGGGTFNSGALVTVSAVANAGYTFANWTEAGIIVSMNANYQFTITSNRTLIANYTPIQFTVAVSSMPFIGGITSGGGTFNLGASVSVNAMPNNGFTFTNWTEGSTIVSTNANYQFTIIGNRTLVANYTPILYTVAVSSMPILGGITNGGGTFNSGASVTVNAVANSGFIFINWKEGSTIVSTNANYQFTITANRNLVANFTPIQYTVAVSSLPLLGGITTGGGTYNSGASVTVNAVANSGFTFTNWKEGLNIVSTNANYQFNITGNRILVANFTANVIPPSGPLAIDLGCAEPFAILAGSTITSTGPTIINGDVGLSAGTALVGFPPGIINGVKQITTPTAAAAKLCLTTAFIDGQSRSLNSISMPGQLGGLTLAPGLYTNSTTSGISGTGANGILTLDAQGNANSVWIFQMGSTFTTDPATSVVLAGGALAKNIFWVVGTSATLGTNSVFYGNILADQSITLNTGAVLNGRALTRIAAVSLDASIVTKPQ